MGFVNIYVSKDAYIYVKNSQLIFENKDKKWTIHWKILIQ